MIERDIQRALFQQWRVRHRPDALAWHTPNNPGARRYAGFLAGVSDVVAVHRGEHFALELKKEGGRATLEEMEFIDNFRRSGGHAMVAYGLDEALMYLKSWGLIR